MTGEQTSQIRFFSGDRLEKELREGGDQRVINRRRQVAFCSLRRHKIPIENSHVWLMFVDCAALESKSHRRDSYYYSAFLILGITNQLTAGDAWCSQLLPVGFVASRRRKIERKKTGNNRRSLRIPPTLSILYSYLPSDDDKEERKLEYQNRISKQKKKKENFWFFGWTSFW